ncbi:MAG TPA: hypothetical protein VNJ29_03800, partial [Candidatus Nitrosotenuis sp.]|nr:hypothetical protein [Candidatus Nitrosotenuis sp.]
MRKLSFFILFLSFSSIIYHTLALEKEAKDIDEYVQICADHMVMVFHAYDQNLNKTTIDFNEPVHMESQFMKVFPYKLTRDSIHEELLKGWVFKPFYGETGIKFYSVDWREHSLLGMIA